MTLWVNPVCTHREATVAITGAVVADDYVGRQIDFVYWTDGHPAQSNGRCLALDDASLKIKGPKSEQTIAMTEVKSIMNWNNSTYAHGNKQGPFTAEDVAEWYLDAYVNVTFYEGGQKRFTDGTCFSLDGGGLVLAGPKVSDRRDGKKTIPIADLDSIEG